MARKKVVKRGIYELIEKGMFKKNKKVKIVLKNNTKLSVLDWGEDEKTLEYVLKLSDGSSRNFSRYKHYYFEVPNSFNVVMANKERQYK